MRLVVKSLSIMVLVSLLIGGFMSCDPAGTTTDEESHSNGGSTTITLTPYSAVDYADLGTIPTPTEATVTAIETWDPEVTDALIGAVDGLSMIFEGLELLEDEAHTATFVPKSITGTVALSVEDEHFAIEEDLGATTETWLDLDIDHLDLVLSGGIHSLTALIDTMVNDPIDPTAMFPANGQIGLSFKADITGRIDDDEGGDGDITLKNFQSGYLDIAVANLDSDVLGNLSGTLHAKLSYSAAMNYLIQREGDAPPILHHIPVVLSISMQDINNASLAAIGAAMDAIDNLNPEDYATYDEFSHACWTPIKTALWGTSAASCIRMTATYKDADGSVQILQDVADQYALPYLMQILMFS